jgi:alpha-1,3-rhamnosyl/mannosyltransferase
MRIVIDGRYINDHFPGIGRYIYNLLLALGELAPPHTFAVLSNPELPNTRYDIAALARHLPIRIVATRARPFSAAEQASIPHVLRTMRADLYHAPYYVRPYAGVPCPSVTTLYDAIPRLFPNEASPRARLLFDVLTRLAIRESAHVLAISASARDDFVAAYGLAPSRVTVTPLAAGPRFCPQPPEAVAAVRAKYGLSDRYVLSLSSNKPHKNLVGLVEAWARVLETGRQGDEAQPRGLAVSSSPCLVIAGHWDPHYPEARMAAARLGLGERARFLHGAAEADLPALLSGAEVFAFPSRYEGFGLPPLEAMACGAPVLCCDTSSLPEVVGDAALRVRPTPDALADGLARLLGNSELRGRLREAGLRRAEQFSWKKTAEATLAVYEQVGAKS